MAETAELKNGVDVLFMMLEALFGAVVWRVACGVFGWNSGGMSI